MKATDELLKQIKELNIEDFKKQESFDCISIDEYLCSLLTSHNLQPKDIILNLNMERSYTYQILNDAENLRAIFFCVSRSLSACLWMKLRKCSPLPSVRSSIHGTALMQQLFFRWSIKCRWMRLTNF